MSDPYLGQIIAVGFTFPPVGWAACDGSLLSIAENDALYALLGTTYGGDGVQTFGLPDLRGRSPLGIGTGSGLSTYVQGQQGGVESVQLTGGQVGAHNHNVSVSSAPGTANVPAADLVLASQGPAGGSPQVVAYADYDAANQTTLSPATVAATGSAAGHENRQPSLALNYLICLNGIFPSQS